jgi:hypothetical protein
MGPTTGLLPPSPPRPPKAELALVGLPAGGLLHSPHHGDPWRDCGLLGVPDPALAAASTAPLSFQEFISEAYPRYGFHRWALVLIALLQAIAVGQLSRLIVRARRAWANHCWFPSCSLPISSSATRTCSPPLPAIPASWPMPIPVRRGIFIVSPAIHSPRIRLLSATGSPPSGAAVLRLVWMDPSWARRLLHVDQKTRLFGNSADTTAHSGIGLR